MFHYFGTMLHTGLKDTYLACFESAKKWQKVSLWDVKRKKKMVALIIDVYNTVPYLVVEAMNDGMLRWIVWCCGQPT